LALQQRFRDPYQGVAINAKNALGRRVTVADYATHFLVNFDRSSFAIVAVLGNFAAQEDLLFFLSEGQRTQIAHAELAYHLASQFGGALDVVSSAGAHLAEEKFFGQTPTHHDGDLRLEIGLGVIVLVVDRQLHGDAKRHAAR